MTAAEAAENIKNKIDELARDAGERINDVYARPEAWLDEQFRRRHVEQVVRELLIDYLIGKRP